MNHQKTLIEELAQADLVQGKAHAAVAAMFILIRDGECGAALIGAVLEAIRQDAEAVALNVASRRHVDGPLPQAASFRSAGSAETAYPDWQY